MLSQYANTSPQRLWILRKIKMTQESYFDYKNSFKTVLETQKNSEICQNQHVKAKTHQTHSKGFLLCKNERMRWRRWEEMHEDDNDVLRRKNSLPKLTVLDRRRRWGLRRSWRARSAWGFGGFEVLLEIWKFWEFESVKLSVKMTSFIYTNATCSSSTAEIKQEFLILWLGFNSGAWRQSQNRVWRFI